MTVITYNAAKDAVTGLEWDKPSVELLLKKYSTAVIYNTDTDPGLIDPLVADKPVVDGFLASLPVNELVLCVGGEEVNGIVKVLTELGAFCYTVAVSDGAGFIKAVIYNDRRIVVFTGGGCNIGTCVNPNISFPDCTTIENSRMGTVNACWHHFKTGQAEYDFEVKIPAGADRLTLAGLDVNPADVALFKANEDFLKWAVKDQLLTAGYAPDTFEVVDAWVENDKVQVIVVEFGSPEPITIGTTLFIAIMGVVGTAVYYTYNYFHTEQVKQETLQKPFDLAIEVCKINPAQCTPELTKNASDAASSILAGQIEIEKWKAEQKGALGEASDLVRNLVIAGVVGVGAYFLFQSGLFSEGVRRTKGYIESKQPRKVLKSRKSSVTKKK